MKHDYAILIGRFQPFHNGHLNLLHHALSVAQTVIVVIGSTDAPRTIRNPWTFTERQEMISRNLKSPEVDRVIFVGVPDFIYDDTEWVSAVEGAVHSVINASFKNKTIATVGFKKDVTSDYLSYFPQWEEEHISTPIKYLGKVISSTDIRDLFFSSYLDDESFFAHRLTKTVLPFGTIKYLLTWLDKDSVNWKWKSDDLRAEKRYIDSYRQAWSGAPFPPTFVTVDSVVVQSGHVLLVEHGEYPGKGLWAIPGGFVSQT